MAVSVGRARVRVPLLAHGDGPSPSPVCICAHPLAHDLPPSSVPVPVRQPVALPIPIRVRPPVALPIGMPVTQRGEWLTDYFSTDEGLARRVLDTVTLPGETFCIRLDQNPSFRRPLRAVEGSRIYQSS